MFRQPKTSLLLILTILTILGAAGFTWKVLEPAWRSPMSRSYESRLGYAAVVRERGAAFPVRAIPSQQRQIDEVHLGEGMIQSTPVLVPVVPMARIEKVFVAEGDSVEEGQLLARLDTAKIDIKVESAQAALATARAELERVRVGSPESMRQERPQLDSMRVNSLEREAQLKAESLGIHEDLLKQGLVSRELVLNKRIESLEADEALNEARWALETAQVGMRKSVAIAESQVREAELNVKFREVERRDHQIYAATAGLVQRVLIHEGEFNQDPGRPAFLLATDAWFEAHLDQADVGHVAEGDVVEVFLEARPGRSHAARVARVLPFVTFNQGGPEATRPIRPTGTGAPEWPATFKVRIELNEFGDQPIVAGLTGFARIHSHKLCLAVPRSALLSVSAGSALVNVLVDDDHWERRQVTLGVQAGDWVEIIEGIGANERVLIEGHEVLEEGDRIRLLEAVISPSGFPMNSAPKGLEPTVGQEAASNPIVDPIPEDL